MKFSLINLLLSLIIAIALMTVSVDARFGSKVQYMTDREGNQCMRSQANWGYSEKLGFYARMCPQ